jgi:hypothetical protein
MRGLFRLRGEPDEVREGIRAAQVSAVFRQMPIALAVNAVNAIITFLVLQQLIDFARPLAWVCVVALVTSGRWALWLRYRRLRSSITAVAQWSWLAACGSLLAGMCWGLGGLVLFPITPVLGQIFLTFVIGGMCAGAVVNQRLPPAEPSCLPALRQLTYGGPVKWTPFVRQPEPRLKV